MSTVRGALLVGVLSVTSTVLLTACSTAVPGTAVAGSTPTATTSDAAPTTTTTADPAEPAEPEPLRPGWQVVVDEPSGLAHDVPPDWVPGGGELVLPGGPLTQTGRVADYECEGGQYSRGVTFVGTRPAGDLAAAADAVAREAGPLLYSGSTTQVGPPEPVPLGATSGVVLVAVVTAPPGPCLATTGAVTVAVVDDGDRLQVFLGNVDTGGGPAEPPVRTETELVEVSATLRAAP